MKGFASQLCGIPCDFFRPEASDWHPPLSNPSLQERFNQGPGVFSALLLYCEKMGSLQSRRGLAPSLSGSILVIRFTALRLLGTNPMITFQYEIAESSNGDDNPSHMTQSSLS